MEEKKAQTLLVVDSCISQRGADSRTRKLLEAYVEGFFRRHPQAQAETVTQQTLLELRPFTPAMLNDRDALAAVGAWEAPVFALARQFRRADCIVVAAPFWDLSFPAALRTYIEYISANGLTYHYASDGCHGDCRAEKLVYLTSGGDVERPESLGVAYGKQLCTMFGIGRFAYLFAGGLDLDPAAAPALAQAAADKARCLGEEP